MTTKQKRLGIIGGLGPKASCKFCLHINNKFRDISGSQPDITMENVPVSSHLEKKIINGENSHEMFDLLRDAVIRLNNVNVDFIVIPCNTVHIFINQLRKISKKPILSIIEECTKECRKRNFKKIALLATTTTVKKNLFSDELKNSGIDPILPSPEDQQEISRIIIRTIHNTNGFQDKKRLLKIIDKLKEKGAEAVILGCTELSLLISNEDCDIPVLDSCAILEDSTVNNLILKWGHDAV